MTDTIIKGSGNSRTLKTVPNIKSMVSNLDDLLDLFIAGFPVDVGPLNEAGVQTHGTDLNKASLLTDALCTALGLATTATPNQALDKLRQIVNTAQSTANGKARVQTGSYNGNGSSTKTLSFGFAPRLVLVAEKQGNESYSTPLIYNNPYGYARYSSSKYDLSLSWGGNSLTWTCTESDTNQGVKALNGIYHSGVFTYYYIAIG